MSLLRPNRIVKEEIEGCFERFHDLDDLSFLSHYQKEYRKPVGY